VRRIINVYAAVCKSSKKQIEICITFYGFLSHLSLAFASAVVCHCILDGSSAPPSANAFVWSMTNPGQLPVDLPVDGQGFCRSNCRLASRLLFILPFEFRVHDALLLLLEWCLLLACPEVAWMNGGSRSHGVRFQQAIKEPLPK
jgi:hypothetical protein